MEGEEGVETPVKNYRRVAEPTKTWSRSVSPLRSGSSSPFPSSPDQRWRSLSSTKLEADLLTSFTPEKAWSALNMPVPPPTKRLSTGSTGSPMRDLSCMFQKLRATLSPPENHRFSVSFLPTAKDSTTMVQRLTQTPRNKKTPGSIPQKTPNWDSRRSSWESIKPSQTKQERTPAALPVKIIPRRPSKGNHARKLSMTDFEDNRHLGSPPPSKRRTSPTLNQNLPRDSLALPPPAFLLRDHMPSIQPIREPHEREINVRNLTDSMVRKGIKLLALDWDLTLVACHTHGQWYGKADELARQVRPVFHELVGAAVASGLGIAVVSFSSQHHLIREALAIALPNVNFILRCSDNQWSVQEQHLRRYFPRAKGSPAKLKHVFSAVQQLTQANKENSMDEVAPNNIVLIDDDQKNIEHARRNGMVGILMRPPEPARFLYDLDDVFPPT